MTEDCGSGGVGISAGVVGYLEMEAYPRTGSGSRHINYGWVDYPNYIRSWNSGYATTSSIFAISSSAQVWSMSPKLFCG